MLTNMPTLTQFYYQPNWDEKKANGIRLFFEIEQNNLYVSASIENELAPCFFEHHTINKPNNFFSADAIKQIQNNYTWLAEVPIVSCTVAIQNNQYKLLPHNFSAPPKGGWQIENSNEFLDGKIVFEISSGLKASLQNFGTHLHITHSMIGLIHQIKALSILKESGILCNIHQTNFDIAVWQNKQIKMLNTYQYEAPDDILYFIQLAYKQFNFEQNTELMLGGDIVEQSLIYTTLCKFFATITFAKRNVMQHQGVFKNILPHRFLNFSGIISCE
jgi:hypothetical protein